MTDEFLDPTENSEALAKLQSSMKSEFPIIEPGRDNLVNLPGGFRRKGKLVKKATVRELTGEDEELLAKANRSGNIYHFIDTLLGCGTEDISKDELSNMLVGDRDSLLLGIRAATYGPEIEYAFRCPFCDGKSDLEFEVSDIPVKKLEGDIEFDVELRRGKRARLRLANGADQLAVFDQDDLTVPERDTILLSRCVLSITDKDGTETNVAAFPSAVRQLSIPDRKKLLNEIATGQPGPKLDEITIKHDPCGNEVALEFGLGDLFPGLA